MDELTRERYGDFVPWRETHARPRPKPGRFPLAPLEVIEERRRVLDEGLRRKQRDATD